MKNRVRKPIDKFRHLRGTIEVEVKSLQETSRLHRKLIWIPILSIIFSSVHCFVFAAPSEQNKDRGNISLAPVRQKTQAITLTKAEQAWLEAHPNIVLGYTDAFEPEVIVGPEDGSLRGIQVDILAELNRRIGTRIGLRIYPVSELVDKAQQKEVDGILSLHPGYADKLGLLKSRSYFTGYPTVFTRKGIPFDSPADLAGKKVAIVDKVFFSEQIIQQHGRGAKILKVRDAIEGLQCVNNGQADYFLGASLNAYLITKYQLFDLVSQYVFYDYRIDAVIGTRSDWPELSSILDKGLSSFSKEEIEVIVAKWSHQPKPTEGIELTDDEQAWLEENHTVRVRVSDFPPYMILGEGEPTGISIDYLKLITERTGIDFEFIKETRPLDEAFEAIKHLEGPDLIQCRTHTAERESYASFTRDYLASPRVIFTRTTAMFLSEMEDLKGKTVAVSKGTVVSEQLASKFPDIYLMLLDTDEQSLKAVATGKADAYIGNLTIASYLILEHGLSNLKVAAPTPFGDHVFSFGVRKDWPELRSIIDTALDSVTPGEKMAIRSKYLSMKYEYGIRPGDIVKWAIVVTSVAAFIIIVFITWNRTLNRRVKERTLKLSESEERFRATFEQAAVGIAHVTQDGRFIRVNQKFCDIVGYDNKEMLNLTFQDITHPDDLEADIEQAKELLAGKLDTYSMEKRYSRKGGEIVWIHLTVSLVRGEAGQPLWFVSVVKDISERRQAEEELKDSEENFRNLMEQSPISIQIHTPDGRLSQTNTAYAKLYALNKETLAELYEKYNVLKDEQARRLGVMPSVEKVFTGNDVLFPEYEYDGIDTLKTLDFKKPISKKCWVQTRGYPVKDKDGEVTSVVFMSEDITERKKAEEEIRRLRDEYTHIARVSAMGELTASLAHELKQPLAAIRSNAQAAQRFLTGDKPDIDELHEVLKDIIKDNRRADDVIARLRSLMQKGEIQITQLDMNEILGDILPLINSYEIVRNISVKLELSKRIPHVNGDRVQLQQVILNLILNSTEALGNVKVKSGIILVRTSQEDKQSVIVSVTDNGPGIEEEAMGHVFEPFFTTKQEGLGMGLAISRSIIEEHGGRLWAENSPDGGATFYFTVPIAKGDSA